MRIAVFTGAAVLLLLFLAGGEPAWGGTARGIFALNNAGGAVPEPILNNPSVDGVALLFRWNQIEPGDGQFDWQIIDQQVTLIRASGKVYSLGITPGVNTPQWVYAEGAAAFQFAWDKPWGPPPCTMVSFPVPWDPVYMEKWSGFVRALGSRYSDDPALVLLKIQGVNAQTPEFLLPYDHTGAKGGPPLVNCQPSNETAEWQSLGYRPSKVEMAWETFASAFRSVFPTQELALETGPWGMPPINDSGSLMASRAADTNLPTAIISIGKQMLDGEFVAQNDGLQAHWCWSRLGQFASPAPIAFQMAWNVTDDPTCRMNHFERPCDAQKMLQSSIDRGLAAGASYLEIYEADLLNPALGQIIADAHRRLTSSDARSR
jgi:hypothetical protein